MMHLKKAPFILILAVAPVLPLRVGVVHGKAELVAKLIAPEVDSHFGEAIAARGDTLVIGAPFFDHKAEWEEAAYILKLTTTLTRLG